MNVANRFIWVVVLGLFGYWGKAQIQISLPPMPEAGIALEQLWQVQINNYSYRTTQVILISEIRRQGQLVYRKQSKPIVLSLGQQDFNPALLRVEKESFPDPILKKEVQRTGQFPIGHYQVCLLIKNPSGDELGRSCQQAKVDAQDLQTPAPSNGLQWSGQGTMEYFYTDQPFWGTQVPRQYLRFDLHPRVQWQDIPIGIDVFYTTDNQNWNPAMNAISLHFDAQRFQEQMREKLRTKLEDRSARIQQEYALDFKKEEQLVQQLGGLADSSLTQYQQLLPQLEKRLQEYPEKELRYRERQLRQRLDNKRLAYQNTRKQLLQKGSNAQVPLDSLDNNYRQWEQKQGKVQEELIRIQQKIKDLEQLKREISAGRQRLQKHQSLQGRSAFLQAQHSQIKQQNDSLRQLLPPMASFSDPNEFKRQLRQEGLLKKHYSWLMTVEELKLGTYRPHYSPLILNGAQANGISLRISPLPAWSFSASVGKIRSPLLFFTNQNGKDTLSPVVAAGKIAWKTQHVRAYGMAALPLQKNTPNAPESINGPPSGNLKLGAGLELDLFDQRFTTQLDGAWTNLNMEDPVAETTSFAQRTAVHWNSQWLLSEQTRFTALWQSVGTAYEDIGSPFLLSGMEQIDLQLEQDLWKNQLTVGGFYMKDKNRPIGFSPFTFQNHQYGLQLGWIAEGYPQISTRLGRNLLSNEDNDNQGWLWSFLANYPFQMGHLQLNTQLSLQHTQQQLNSQLAPQLYTYLEFRQQVSWNDRFSTSLSVYQNTGGLSEELQDFRGVDLQVSLHKKQWHLDLTGGLYQQDRRENDYRVNLNLRIPFSKSIHFTIQAGRQPSFVNTSAYHFIRTGFRSLF